MAKKIKKSRAIVYKDLEELVDYKIVEKVDKPNQVSVFRIGNPANLEKFFDDKENRIKKERELFSSYLPDMVSTFNLLSNKPGVRYYEGKKGIMNMLNHISKNFKPDSEIISFEKTCKETRTLM